ncbi:MULTISPECIES: Zn(2+)-responsive transcriptional regulator [unclassified Photobacterium]|uniref:Zn(2+)-responsive transcriptional regulator n=1 Tax=unclassified Photobacterium TaxID=2628852 RepID=UPI000D176022|nr:Zn(2+)-responsive transcriptional regulator [Photobacterium sp. GB-56]PSV29887.1 Zn(2+)-responsive transcriptional regulator [Photobacterium sp. GB-72]PSV35303.1 Zn(2+)-responsive transcriptional regulator [Photobacterium sp. GB-210]PSV36185.1 Zn(2+)-responsive transcriptional regulator [Photobacterium sp. GB-27]PSV41658.1 Zn(2+)-responsive transcriptional regulator [Photobacterium sp. GB-36]PSV51199.1 Zn(2+)-responsive transcriptional regulator [Photobacterium sp. GB-1]PSV53862.1 Zn(2+)-r
MAMYLIGQLAKLCQVSSDTLRFYEKNDLLQPAGRSDSGYRLYSDDNLSRVKFILRAKAIGLSLEEIRELLDIRLEASQHSCAEVKAITQAKLDEVDMKIKELSRIRRALKKINDACCGHVDDDASHCSILEALNDSCDTPDPIGDTKSCCSRHKK